MGESLAFAVSSQSSLLLPNPRLHFRSSPHFTSLSFFSVHNHRPHTLRLHQSRFLLSPRVVSNSEAAPTALVVDSSAKASEIEADTTGGDIGDGKEGGGGGGGGDGGDSSGSSGEGEGEPGGDSSKRKMALSMSQKLTLGYAALVGVGGLMGYLKSGSVKSLISGGISAGLLFYVYTELPTRPVFASSIGLGISAALLGVMGSRFKRSGKVFPAGVVSLVSLVMTGGYLHGIMRRGLHGKIDKL
ncbi:TMEM14 family [Dillenia turbinata]|uniref:TMEM14 family n=1 Tax=Dillenia turbinata TaxID=194707 RepID=A0AAN8Z9Z6_9MAGN